tara:strand:- start:60111 stop:61010 length:900 start_codon:yes stop_codon:yes gene_type:complete
LVKIILAHTFLLFANLIYAINYSFAKDVMPTFIMPSGFILLRVLGAFFLFFLLHKILIREKVEAKDLLRLVACGFFGVAVNQLFFFEGLNLSTPINASIIMTINPIIVIIISFFMLKESFGIKKIFGVLLGLVGAGILILNNGEIDLSNNLRTGNILVLINASSYAFYLVIVKPLMTRYNPITILTYVFGFGILFVLPFGYDELWNVKWNIMPKTIFWQIIFVVFCTTFLAYLFNAYALKNLNPTTVSIYIYIQPVLASVFAVFWGIDKINNEKITSALIIFIGVYLVSQQNRPKDKLS